MKSIWLETTTENNYPQLLKNISVDVCIIGAGITGITLAYLLNKQGLSVALLERNKICSRSYRKYNWKNNKSTWNFLQLSSKHIWKRNRKILFKFK